MLLLKWRKVDFVSIVIGFFVLAAFKANSSAANTIVFEDDFESCNYQKYLEVAHNKIDRSIRHSGNCSSKIGGDGVGFGKLLAKLPGNTELWLRAYVFFPSNFELTANAQGNSGIHFWRFTDMSMQFDFNVPAHLDTIQLYHAPGNSGGEPVVKWTKFKPAADSRRGRWQCWEVHSRLNGPGRADGLLEFYADSVFVDSVSGNLRGNSTASYSHVDVQSNIGGPNPGWPQQNWWYIDDVVVSTERVGCLPDTGDKTPPKVPTGVRIDGQ